MFPTELNPELLTTPTVRHAPSRRQTALWNSFGFLPGVLTVVMSVTAVFGQRIYPPELPGSTPLTYKTVGDTELKLWMYYPEDHDAATDRRPAMVFFFGGGWKSGTPAQFETHCRYLASRGIVAATADYRVATTHGVKADACVEDGKSAVRWLRQNAAKLGIDPNRIGAGGGSAGGHVACCTGVISGFEAEGEDQGISSVPNAMALFNPAVMIARLNDFEVPEILPEKWDDIASRTGVPPEQISPIHHIRSDQPPTIIFHGKADPTVPFATVREYQRRATKAGSRCELSGFASAPHGFFNLRSGNPEQGDLSDQWYRRTLRQLDQFLQSLHWLEGDCPIRIVDQDFVSFRGHCRNSFHRFAKQNQGHVAFLGGSITEMNGYRPLIQEWLKARFPETAFVFTDAGISSTCSHTGAFRLHRDVLSQGPVDLLFVEYAVNDDQDAGHSADDCIRGMEGIVQQTRRHNPQADIVMTHFVNPGMLTTLAAGEQILSASQHERVARHYQVSSVYLSKVVAERIRDGHLTWTQFGGTHPGPAGNRLAAEMATSVLHAAWEGLTPESVTPADHETPDAPLLASSFSNGRLVSPEHSQPGEGWEYSTPEWDNISGGKRSRFLKIPMLHSEKPGAEAELKFSGTSVGAYIVAGPDAGQLEVQIDDQPWQTVELYHRFSSGLHYPRTVMFAVDLPEGVHTVKMRVADAHHTASKGTAVRIIAFAVSDRGFDELAQ